MSNPLLETGERPSFSRIRPEHAVPAIERILDRAKSFTEVSEREIKKVPTLRGRTVINLFYEASTRTQSSFELAAKRLSADLVTVKSTGSAVEKGESLKDTVQTLSAYDPAAIVIRHPHAGAAGLVGWAFAGYPALAAAKEPAVSSPAPMAVPRVSSRPASPIAEWVAKGNVHNIRFNSSFESVNPALREPLTRELASRTRRRAPAGVWRSAPRKHHPVDPGGPEWEA